MLAHISKITADLAPFPYLPYDDWGEDTYICGGTCCCCFFIFIIIAVVIGIIVITKKKK